MNHKSTPPAEVTKRGLARDLSRLKQDGTASAAEVRDFIRQMRGKSPHEVLGSVAQSSLTQGVTLATLATVVLIFAFTAGPYALGKTRVEKKSTPPPAAAAAEQPAAATDQAAVEPAAAPETGPGEKALDVLGVSETKQADPGKNPLEDKGDDLLKDLK